MNIDFILYLVGPYRRQSYVTNQTVVKRYRNLFVTYYQTVLVVNLRTKSSQGNFTNRHNNTILSKTKEKFYF